MLPCCALDSDLAPPMWQSLGREGGHAGMGSWTDQNKDGGGGKQSLDSHQEVLQVGSMSKGPGVAPAQ